MNKNNNASFIQRLIAYIIDITIISSISIILSIPFANDSNYKKLSEESTKVMTEYMDGKITPRQYLNQGSDISYDISRKVALVSIFTIAISITYFAIYQFKKNGQTFGKKLCKIRVVSEDVNNLNINQITIRSLIIDGILADMLLLPCVILGTKDVYFVGNIFITVIQYIILFVTAIMVLSRKDKKGLHDLITKTKVIKEV